VVSAAVGGIVLGYEAARQLGTRAIFVEKEAGAARFRRGFGVSRGERVLVVEDVITTGLSVREVIDVVTAEGGVPAAAAVVVQRSAAEVGAPLYALLDLPMESFEPTACPQCAAGEPLDEPGSRFLQR
jgi:orotate phosphoribosyltransferase